MMNAIGGYLELELNRGRSFYDDSIKLNSARNCFAYILRARQYRKVYIPYYTCDVMLEPINKLGIDYEFYSINKIFEIENTIQLQKNEALLYTNYFGLKQQYISQLSDIYASQLIVDNAQAFYSQRIKNIDTFYSPRKFFGVSDGGYLYTNKILNEEFKQDYSYDRMSHLLKRIDLSAEEGYNDFCKNDNSLVNQSIKKMSKITNAVLSTINYDIVRMKRIENFNQLHSVLKSINQINIPLGIDTPAMIYPLLIDKGDKLKKYLIENKVFVATYWHNVKDWCTSNSFEMQLYNNLVCLPIDQRYNKNDMKHILDIYEEGGCHRK